ncbi:hypothetical protein F0562_019481 [Nyssa sinensis]|uniref:Uncharacterized protein n=1 Tax=Nyssa sinensis TaxID=561372 RepID=A0A5J5A408_9ASTE|nr:hypothetical protein F0562_007448 [Nyssa sinensis]KAA8544672.1 hypothetical protein F0562_019481 [Nyssa sinensis]
MNVLQAHLSLDFSFSHPIETSNSQQIQPLSLHGSAHLSRLAVNTVALVSISASSDPSPWTRGRRSSSRKWRPTTTNNPTAPSSCQIDGRMPNQTTVVLIRSANQSLYYRRHSPDLRLKPDPDSCPLRFFSRVKSKRTQWVTPNRALPLSLFGDEEGEDDVVDPSVVDVKDSSANHSVFDLDFDGLNLNLDLVGGNEEFDGDDDRWEFKDGRVMLTNAIDFRTGDVQQQQSDEIGIYW